MSNERMDELCERVERIYSRRREYAEYFPGFAAEVCARFGEYVGDPAAVRLANDRGEFDFEKDYSQESFKFEGGFFVIPLMIRIESASDAGHLVLRFRLYCAMEDEAVAVSIEHQEAFRVDPKDICTQLCPRLHEYLMEELAEPAFFSHHRSDYAESRLGFPEVAGE